MAGVKAWKVGQPGAPDFPDDFEIVKKAVLQVTDLTNNNNKYYAVELHAAGGRFRVFTHYGRTDDLETNPNAGAKECRYLDSLPEAEACYASIYREKTSPQKGYKEVALASSRIGSQKARGTSSGDVDAKTLQRIAKKDEDPAVKPSTLPPGVQDLVRYVYDEATSALTSTVAARITANGIETPLGILTLGQIEKGEQILAELYDVFAVEKNPIRRQAEQTRLTGEFYTAVPHRIGRTRAAIGNAVINSLELFNQKQETLQLMKDMLQVNGEGGSVLFDARADAEYEALKCQIGCLEPGSGAFKEIAEYVVNSQVKSRAIRVRNVFTLKRDAEFNEFTSGLGNQKLLFHGSRIQNWVGILSRGILLPKIVVSLGVNRTDAGWLGNGLYFGDAACTSAFYTTPGHKGTRFLAIARVALGKMKDFTKITYGLAGPPEGFHSCHGVRNRPGKPSEFEDDEYVVYTTKQQRLEYLVEFAA
ncbi:MAG: WGR domain-containing protein [Gemmataceae bacterium]